MVDRPQVLYMPAYAMTVPYGQFTNLSPAQKLSYSADFPAEILFHQKPTRAADVVNLFRVHHTDPMHVQRATLSHRHIARRPNRAKRPLNSWMGFRTFYSALFATLRQKEASPYLTLLWDEDPFKAKWAIVARAYTHIRDTVGTAMNVRLDVFLDTVTPKIGIIPVREYLSMMCWISSQEPGSPLILTQESRPDLDTFPAEILHTNMTEMDVIRFCGEVGYIPSHIATQIIRNRSKQGSLAQQGLLASAPVAPPASAKRHTNARDRAEAALQVFESGVDAMPAIPAIPDNTEEPYQWTGSMADLYHPTEGSLDLANANASMPCQNKYFGVGVGDVDSPGFVESMPVEDGHWNPDVPEEDPLYYQASFNLYQYP